MLSLKKKLSFPFYEKARNSIGRVAVLHTVCFRFESGRAYKNQEIEKKLNKNVY